jgi:ApaG protein
MYREITDGILVEVVPEYVPEQSRPAQSHYFFAYHVRIRNDGTAPARLLRRHWIITDGAGKTHEVEGEGVIGEQPRLAPGESFEYSSFCPLPTPTGNMRGTYLMADDQDRQFRVRIPLFFLRDLRSVH